MGGMAGVRTPKCRTEQGGGSKVWRVKIGRSGGKGGEGGRELAHFAVEEGTGQFVGWVGEHLFGVIVFDEVAEVHEHGFCRYSSCLPHVVGYDEDGDIVLELGDELFDVFCGYGVEGRGGFVHEEHFGL